MDGASVNTVRRSETQISQVEYKVSRHWAANNDVALREALREQYVRSELQWFDDGQLCWKIITFEWVLKEEDGEMVVVPSLPGVEKWETDPAQAHMPSRHQMGLPDPPSYMLFSTDRLVELYPPSEPMPDWLFTGMGVLGSKHLQRFMRKRNERYGILPAQQEQTTPLYEWRFPYEEPNIVPNGTSTSTSSNHRLNRSDPSARSDAGMTMTFAEEWTALYRTPVPGPPYTHVDPICLTIPGPASWSQQYSG